MIQLKHTLCHGLLSVTLGLAVLPARAQDQTRPGAGNATAITLSSKSPMVQSAREFLLNNIKRIDDASVRAITLDAIANPSTCVAHRASLKASDKNAILQALIAAGLVDVRDNSTFPGGLSAGVFPPLLLDGGACPQLPQTFFSAPGSFFGGHHSYPGGLPVHESFNDVSNQNLAKGYRQVYGHTGAQGFPVIGSDDNNPNESEGMASTFLLSQDVTIAAPVWHDWAKSMVFQWNSDGSEFLELNFGGNGQTDNFGAPGNSKTGAHHMLSAAEAMKRGLPADLVIAQVSAITRSAGRPRFMASAALSMWWAPVLELPGAPKLSVWPLPPKFSSRNSEPSLFHWKTIDFAQSCQTGAAIVTSWLKRKVLAIPSDSLGLLSSLPMTGKPWAPVCP